MCEEGSSFYSWASFPPFLLVILSLSQTQILWLSLSLTPLTDSPGCDDRLTGIARLGVYISRDIARGWTFFKPVHVTLVYARAFPPRRPVRKCFRKNGVRNLKSKLFIKVASISLYVIVVRAEIFIEVPWVLDSF